MRKSKEPTTEAATPLGPASQSDGSSSPGLARSTGRASGEQGTLMPGPGRNPYTRAREAADQALSVPARSPRATLPARLSGPGGAAGLQSRGEAGPAPAPAFGRDQNWYRLRSWAATPGAPAPPCSGRRRRPCGPRSPAPSLQQRQPGLAAETPRESGRRGSTSRVRALFSPSTLAHQSLEDESSGGFVANSLGGRLCGRNFRALVPRPQYLELPTQ